MDHENFWESVLPERYKPGQIVIGRVTTVTRFGIFVELEAGIKGIVQVSELTGTPFGDIIVADLVKVGDELELKVLAVHVDRRMVSLSRRRVWQ